MSENIKKLSGIKKDKEILKNIYGIEKDSLAVELCKLRFNYFCGADVNVKEGDALEVNFSSEFNDVFDRKFCKYTLYT